VAHAGQEFTLGDIGGLGRFLGGFQGALRLFSFRNILFNSQEMGGVAVLVENGRYMGFLPEQIAVFLSVNDFPSSTSFIFLDRDLTSIVLEQLLKENDRHISNFFL